MGRIMKCKHFYAVSLTIAAAFCLSSCQQPAAPPAGVIQMQIFEDKFDGAELDPNRWLVAYRQWGGSDANGGVVPENVCVADGKLIIAAHGDQYAGPVKGINRDRSMRADGKRVGGAIATRDYFASGRYEVRMKVVPKFGAVSALWTFQYAEYYPGDQEYIAKPVGMPDYYAVNHEIDIELPGRPGSAHTGFDFSRALLATWVGENDDEHTVSYANLDAAQNDGQFHTYRFDWHTGSATETRRVEFYIDGILRHTSYTHVPTNAGRLWIGVWFPRNWAGTPDFATEYLTVDWVHITPFREAGDAWGSESFPADGWADSSLKAQEK